MECQVIYSQSVDYFLSACVKLPISSYLAVPMSLLPKAKPQSCRMDDKNFEKFKDNISDPEYMRENYSLPTNEALVLLHINGEWVVYHVKLHTNEDDIYTEFIAEIIQPVLDEAGAPDSSVHLSLNEIYIEFKMWLRDFYPGKTIPWRSEVKRELTSRWGSATNNLWHGIRLINNNRDEWM